MSLSRSSYAPSAPLAAEARDAGTARSPAAGLARPLAWAALAGQLVFVASWLVAGALDPGYSHLEQGVSELGAGNAENAWIANAGLVVLGLSIAALAPGLLAVLPRRRAALVAAALFAIAGPLLALGGVFPLDCGLSQDPCVDRWEAGELSWQHDAHLWVGLGFEVAFVLTPFAIARSLWPRPSGLLALAAGIDGVIILAAFQIVAGSDVAAWGLAHRVGLAVVHLWVVIVAVGILHSTRERPSPSELVPLRPREFFEGSWSGEGELVPWPHFVWRRFPLRFHARREFKWLSEEVWLMDDVATFRRGWVERRRRFFHLVSPDRIHVTADDAPDGTDLMLEEAGYRIAPYRFVVPVGPLRFVLWCRESHRLDPDGSIVDTMRLRWHGLPVARITIRADANRGRP
ncbi:MAG TPA: DUF998 domain-containing protein [Thermoleophilaceae bacterium]|nr:DUF998 domain-containing protein [Thermoleophilaceae bacterium]